MRRSPTSPSQRPVDGKVSATPRVSARVSVPPTQTRLSKAPPSAGLVIDYEVPGACVLAHLRNMTFSAWNKAPTAEDIEAFMSMAQRLSAVYPKNSNVTLVLRGTELPGGPAKAALERLTERYAHAIHSVALVVDGAGFWASMIRSFLIGLHLLRGNDYRSRAFAHHTEATVWLLPPHNAATGVCLTADEIHSACEAILARFRQ